MTAHQSYQPHFRSPSRAAECNAGPSSHTVQQRPWVAKRFKAACLSAGCLGAALVAASAMAQSAGPTDPATASAPAPAAAASAAPITYPTVAAALSALEAKDGTETVVVHSEGWVIINEPADKAQWSFTPAGHAAYPAVVRRIIRRGPNHAVSVETSSLCEAPAAACNDLIKEFATMDQRVTQAMHGRGQAPVPPPQQ